MSEELSLESQLENMKSKWLLAVADLENYKRRTHNELLEIRQFGVIPLARDIFPALDNLQRALKAAEEDNGIEKLMQGLQMVSQQFDAALVKHSIYPIDAVGKPFDPNMHQAIQQISSDKPPMTVLTEVERGFKMFDRVIRSSMVIVSKVEE